MANLRISNFNFRFTGSSVCKFIIIITGMALLASCVRQPNVQGQGAVFLQGVWNEDSVKYGNELSNYTQHKLKFSCDSFYADLTTHSKVNYYADSCFNKGVWKEYVKGTYAVRGDTLFLVGTFTHANYKQKLSGCYRIGQFNKNFQIKKTTANTLLLESLNDHRESALVLKEKITCVPKAL